MRYTIALKDLPFEPEKKQVIYVENQYDERVNAIIRHHYDWLKYQFKRANLEFVYLPMFFNDEEIREKILYYAPYLTSEVIEKAELRSSYLLGFMAHPENKEKIIPSFLFSPKKEDDKWVFKGKSIEIASDDTGDIHQWFEDTISEINEGQSYGEVFSSIRFQKVPVNIDDIDFDIRVSEEDISEQKEENRLSPINDDRRYDEDIEEPSADLAEEEAARERDLAKRQSILNRFGRWLSDFGKKMVEEEDGGYVSQKRGDIYAQEEDYRPRRYIKIPAPRLDDILEEDVQETIEDLERNIEKLRLIGVPLTAIVEFVAKYETISRLHITDDLRIILPDFYNREVKMGALYKAVFFLFLNHPEGIILQHLEDYHHELVNYYLQTSHTDVLSQRMAEAINKLEYPGDNSINVALTRIKAYFKATIDDHLAKHYYIIGKPGEPYKIPLSQELIEWVEDE